MRKERDIIFNKFGGKCAYCGCDLLKGWHVDHLKPVVRYRNSYKHPERDAIENKMPACASCNINKRDLSLEEFRSLIKNFITSLNRDSVQYKIAKRYGLIYETSMPVVFYFERMTKDSIRASATD